MKYLAAAKLLRDRFAERGEMEIYLGALEKFGVDLGTEDEKEALELVLYYAQCYLELMERVKIVASKER